MNNSVFCVSQVETSSIMLLSLFNEFQNASSFCVNLEHVDKFGALSKASSTGRPKGELRYLVATLTAVTPLPYPASELRGIECLVEVECKEIMAL